MMIWLGILQSSHKTMHNLCSEHRLCPQIGETCDSTRLDVDENHVLHRRAEPSRNGPRHSRYPQDRASLG